MNPTDMLHNIVLLDWQQAARLGPDVAGGKGAQLGRLARYGLPVADGCVVAADVYRATMAGDLHEEVVRLVPGSHLLSVSHMRRAVTFVDYWKQAMNAYWAVSAPTLPAVLRMAPPSRFCGAGKVPLPDQVCWSTMPFVVCVLTKFTAVCAAKALSAEESEIVTVAPPAPRTVTFAI